jgi:hypothetical protein
VDALRGDKLRDLVAASPATYPNFRRLELESAYTYNARTDYGYTETVPNHITMITGRPVDQPAGLPNTVHHGYSSNFPGSNHTIHADGNDFVPYKASTFDMAHDNGLRTALYTSKTRLGILERSYDATNGAQDETGADDGRDKIDFAQVVNGANGCTNPRPMTCSAGIVNTLVINMNGATPAHYTFIHLVEPDTVGHASGWDGLEWAASVQTIDGYLGQMFALVEGREELDGHTAIVLTADHGGGVQTHGDETAWENFNIPVFVWGAELPAGTNLYASTTNRFEPGPMVRTTYTDAQQPLRNGDTGNISLALLGLPPIPSSFMQPELILSTPTPGDADGDGDVDRYDLAIVSQNYGVTTGSNLETGDFNDDGRTDLLDLGILQANYGAGTSPNAAVPEPTSLLLSTAALLVAHIFGVARRKRVVRR